MYGHAVQVEKLLRSSVGFLNLVIAIRCIDLLHLLNDDERLATFACLAWRVLLRDLQAILHLLQRLQLFFLLGRVVHVLLEYVDHCFDVRVRHHFEFLLLELVNVFYNLLNVSSLEHILEYLRRRESLPLFWRNCSFS